MRSLIGSTPPTRMAYPAAMLERGGSTGWERLFWLVFTQTSNPVLLIDEQRRIVEVNGAALALHGGERADLIGTSIDTIIKPEDRPAAAQEWQDFLQSGEYSGKRALVRADGSEVRIEFAARLERIAGQRLATYVAMVEQEPSSTAPVEGSGELPLTSREREVITLIALGDETAQIAAKLHISPDTVRTHVRNAMSKLGARTRAQLVALVLCSEHAVHVPSLQH
jgi:PAS domain S-box-containing protein